MAGIIKKQILKHLSRSVGRGAPGRLRGPAGRGRLRVPVPESDPRAGLWAGGRGPFCPRQGELKPSPRSDLEAEGLAGCSCGAVRWPRLLSWPPAPWRCRRGGGLGVPGAGGSHRVSHRRAPAASPPGRRGPPPLPEVCGGQRSGGDPEPRDPRAAGANGSRPGALAERGWGGSAWVSLQLSSPIPSSRRTPEAG